MTEELRRRAQAARLATVGSVKAVQGELEALKEQVQQNTAKVEKTEAELVRLEKDYLSFVGGLMGTSQFPGGAFGRLEEAVKELAESFKNFPAQFNQAIGDYMEKQGSRRLRATGRQLAQIIAAVVIGVATAIIVALIVGHSTGLIQNLHSP